MNWTSDEVERIGGAQELRITSYRNDGSLRRWTPIWVVRVDDALYIRSAYGADGAWYRHAIQGKARVAAAGIEADVDLEPVDEVTNRRVAEAYSAKYSNQPSSLRPMLAEPSASSTVRVTKTS